MAHHKKKTEQQPDKMDQLISLVTWLATEMKNIKQDVDNLKIWQQTQIKPEALKPDAVIESDSSSIWNVQRETPYKVIPIASIIRDESYVNINDAPNWWVKKIYMWIWRTFKNKAEAVAYLERVKQSNPGQQYDIFPV